MAELRYHLGYKVFRALQHLLVLFCIAEHAACGKYRWRRLIAYNTTSIPDHLVLHRVEVSKLQFLIAIIRFHDDSLDYVPKEVFVDASRRNVVTDVFHFREEAANAVLDDSPLP